jgi:hypothetical protein
LRQVPAQAEALAAQTAFKNPDGKVTSKINFIMLIKSFLFSFR